MTTDRPRFRQIALAAIASVCNCRDDKDSCPEEKYLCDVSHQLITNDITLEVLLKNAFIKPAEDDKALLWLSDRLRLTPVELLAVALAAAVEDDPFIGRVISHIQAPAGNSRPTVGLLSHIFSVVWNNGQSILPLLVNGKAAVSGLLTTTDENLPLSERPLAIPASMCIALMGNDSYWPGVTVDLDESQIIPLPESTIADARQHAAALGSIKNHILIIRSGIIDEGKQVASEIACTSGCRPAFINTEKTSGLGVWLLLRKLLPVFCLRLAPGERHCLPVLSGYDGPVLVICGPDGSVESNNHTITNWKLIVPPPNERKTLWEEVLGKSPLTDKLAIEHRHSAGRIAHLGKLALYQANLDGRNELKLSDIITAARTGTVSDLEALAEPMLSQIPDEALVISQSLRNQIDSLVARCRLRDELVSGLGISALTRYRPGVKALFTGESGTGKTLAAGWIATKLGSPLYRIDLSSVTSKYIGETEKNLAQVLACAEQAEVILLFDEADSLFGKRTDVSNSNDRFANAQTNYLLQRIESYDGIVLLTSNNQSSFDAAFARRLDFVIEFSMPVPEERRAIWLSHLGNETILEQQELNQIAALVPLSGGHIRNAVINAAVQARKEKREITVSDIIEGLGVELRKLGRQLPLELRQFVKPVK